MQAKGKRKSLLLGCLLATGLTVGMGTTSVGAQAQTDATVGCGTVVDEITVNPQENRVVDLASHDPERHEAFITLDAPLAAGDYEIFTVAADDHFGSKWYQATEQYRVSLDGKTTPTATPDLPADADWFDGSFRVDADQDLSTVPAEVTMAMPGWSMGEIQIDAATDQLGFHHVQTEGIGVPAEVNSILPMSVTIRCTTPQLTPALTPALVLDKRVDGIDSDGESTDVESVGVGVPFVWVVELLNAGGGPATGIVLEDQMPPGVVLIANQVTATSGTVSVESTSAIWRGSLAPGESVLLSVPALIPNAESFALCLGADIDPGDPFCTNQARVTAIDDPAVQPDVLPRTVAGPAVQSRGFDSSLPSALAAVLEYEAPQADQIITEPPVVRSIVESVDPDPTPGLDPAPAEIGDPYPVVSGELPLTGPADALGDTMGFASGLIVIGAAALISARRRSR